MAEFDGSIYAYVGADIADYQAAMNKITTATQRAFEKAQDAAVNNSNRLVQRVGQIMAQLANNGESLGKRLGTAFSTGLNLSIGEIQRIASSIGEKIPQPIKNGFNTALTAIQSGVNSIANKIPQPIQNAFTKATSSVSSFATSANSKVSSAFSTISSKVSSASNTISNSFVGKVGSSLTSLSSKAASVATKMASSLGSGFSNLSSKATSALNGISQKFASSASAGEKLRSTVAQIAAGFSLVAIAQKGISALTGALDGAVSRVDTMNRFPKTMQLFGYSAEQSKSAIDKLSAGIEGLPTPLDSAVKSAQQLSITTGSLEKGTDLALAFNNAMIGYGATTEGAEQALRQFNQSLGSGKIYAEEFNSVSEAAPGLMSKMAEAFGYGSNGVQDLKSALSNGEITAQQFADKMIELNGVQGGFAEMAQASAGGIRTAWQNVNTAVVKGVANMITAFDEAAKANGLKTISESLLALKPAINEAFNTVNAVIPNLVAAFAKLKSMINIDTSGFGQGIKAGFDLLNTALGEFAQKR